MFSSICIVVVFFVKQKTAYEMRISDWSSDVCSSDLSREVDPALFFHVGRARGGAGLLELHQTFPTQAVEIVGDRVPIPHKDSLVRVAVAIRDRKSVV